MSESWKDRMDSIRKGCAADGWDSYGALAVSGGAMRAASHLCDSLDVVPTNDGGIELSMAGEAISVTVNSAGEVTGFYVDTEDAASFLREVS